MRRLVFLLALFIAPVATGDETTKPDGQVVPFELLASKHLAVQVTINGHGPYRLIFDTGSPVVLLNAKLGKECELFGSKARPPANAKVWPGQINVKTLEMGSVKAKDVPAMVMDHPTLKAMESMIGKVDGIVGYPFFARYAMTVDYPARQLVLKPNGNQPDDVMQALMKTMFDRKAATKTLASAGQWGLEVVKAEGQSGVLATTVYGGSAAAAAGLMAGDIILSIDGRWTDSLVDCRRAVAAAPPGQAVEVNVDRAGQKMTVSVTPRLGF